MFFIGRMNFSAFFVPYSCVYSREEGIGFRRCIIYFGQAQLAYQGYTGDRRLPSDDVYFSSAWQLSAASSEVNTSAPGHSAAGLEERTTFRRLGNALSGVIRTFCVP